MTRSFAIDDSSQVSVVRRAVTTVAERLEFSGDRTGKAALVVTELGTNILKHAKRGEILLTECRPGTRRCVEILALDNGGGFADFARSSRDGHSTAGTLGHGLGAVERNTDFFQVFSQPSKGVAALCRIWDTPGSPAVEAPFSIAGVSVPKPGEDVCGDAWSAHVDRDQLSVIVADGLGHGLLAFEAARAAIEVFSRQPRQTVSAIVGDIHQALRATRGAAVGVLTLKPEREAAAFAGLGNIAASIVTANVRKSLVSNNGTAGHAARSIQEFTYPLALGSMLVMHSDGLGTHWNPADYLGLQSLDPALIAGVLYRDFTRRRDDVTVVVGKRSLST